MTNIFQMENLFFFLFVGPTFHVFWGNFDLQNNFLEKTDATGCIFREVCQNEYQHLNVWARTEAILNNTFDLPKWLFGKKDTTKRP